jgi:serine/threonine-protein kinase
MAHEDWKRVEELFHAACGMPASERTAYLHRECAGDTSLREEVESLLSAYDARPEFMAQPAFSLGLRVMAIKSVAESLVGKQIGSYQILAHLGRGGMGEVYLAEDGQLGRKVALKFLSHKLADDSWGKRQLRKEAQSAARLDHPNICAVYGLEELDGYSFIVMQYVEGETLSSHIRNGTLPQERIPHLALQITSALAEAHAHGIIHRDIKPQNIMVSTGGQAKVLDFGLAKSVRQGALAAGDGDSQISDPGLVIGTVGYMSPEQLRAERLDYGSDIFSLGTLLYELFSGENPFARASGAETITAILTSQPKPLRNIAPDVSTGLERIVHKCLAKDRAGRFYSASELLYELSALQQENYSRPRPRKRLSIAAFTLLTLLVAVPAFIYLRQLWDHLPGVASAPNMTAARSVLPSATNVHSLAVLPISAEGAGNGLEYLADGLTESLIGKLYSFPELRVKAFTSVSGYKGKPVDPQSAGRELNVDILLLGKIIRRRNSLVLQSRLVRAEDGSLIWAGERYIQLADVLSLQDDIAKSVTDSLELRSTGEKAMLASHGTANPEAFRLYMLGRYYWRNRNEENIKKAIGYFNRAIKIDPVFAQAHSGLADSYVLLSTVSFGKTPPEEAMSKATAAAKEALTLNGNLPEAHTSLGVVSLRYDFDWGNAEREFKKAIELKPDHAPAHYWYSSLLIILGRRDEAVAESEIAKNLDPFSPPSVMNFCRTLSLSRQYDRAIACYDKLVEEDPDNDHAQYLRGLAYQRSGRVEDALGIFQRLYKKNRALAGAALGYAYGKKGRMEEARKVLAEMEELSKQRYVPPQEFAIIYIGLGDNDNAFKCLEKAYQEHFPTLAYLAVDPIFSSLHSDARFVALTERLKLPAPTM